MSFITKHKALLLACLCAGLVPVAANARSLGPDTYSNPVYNIHDCADPSVERGPDGRFYAFVTGGWGRESEDMVNWRDSYAKIESIPNWNGYEGLWAPDVTRVGDKYLMYYAHSTWMGDLWDQAAVGVAVADNIAGPYKDHGKLFTSREIGVYNSIDPFLFVEDDGRLYLAWGSYWGGIYAIELNSDGLSIKAGAEKVQLTAPDFEGCMIHKHNGYYYLFGSCGTCCEAEKSTYTTVVGRATNFFGPYYDRAGGRMLDGKYHIVISNNRYFKGTGHNAEIITDDAGNDWIYYHAFQASDPGTGRILMMDRVRWEDDWPVINNGFPADCQVPAPYVHDYAADPAMEVSAAVMNFECKAGESDTKAVSVTVRNLVADVTARIEGADAALFSASPAAFSENTTLTVDFAPTAICRATATLVLESEGAAAVRVALDGEGTDPKISYSDRLGDLETVWLYSQNTGNLAGAPWFSTASPFSRSMTVIGDKLYVLNAQAWNNSPVLNVIDANTGAETGKLSLAGLPTSGQLLCGGALGHLGDQLIMSNAVQSASHKFIIYKWNNNQGDPVRILETDNTLGMPYGEIMSTWGDMTRGRIAFGNASKVVYFNVNNGSVDATPVVVDLPGAPLVEEKNSPRGKFEVRFMDDGTFWLTSHWMAPTHYRINGSAAELIESLPEEVPASTSGTAFIPFNYAGGNYAAMVSTLSATQPHAQGALQIVDLADGIAGARSAGIYPEIGLGDANWTSSAACTQLDMNLSGKHNSLARFWVMVPQQGIGHFRYNGEDLSGLTPVAVGEQEAPEQWYNLQGMAVSRENLIPGIYICRKGTIVRKVVIK